MHMESDKSHLYHYLSQMQHELASEYELIRKSALEDPGTAGDQGEENWAKLLRGWLPSNYEVVTKGRIVDHTGQSSPQVDVIVLHPAYPRSLLSKKYYLAGGVVAAFECKITLRTEHLETFFETAKLIKQLVPTRVGTPYRELQQPIIYGLLAHSHAWKKRGVDQAFDLLRRIDERQFWGPRHPREMADLLCVADTATYYLGKNILVKEHMDEEERDDLTQGWEQSEGIMTGYAFAWNDASNGYPGNSLGVFIAELLRKMAFEDPSIRRIVNHFIATDIHGGGIGTSNLWELGLLSEKVVSILRDEGPSKDLWDEWYPHLG